MSSTTSGTYEDCSTLLANYEKNATVGKWEFSEFAKEWRAMRFELIFSGRQYMAELPDFCRSLFNIAKSFIFNPGNSTTRRIGAFFLCYGLYEKQPLKTKMRLTLEELKMLWNLVQSKENPEPLFIFSKMFMENAFHFCATSTDHVLLRKKPVETKSSAATEAMTQIVSVSDLELGKFLANIDTSSSWNQLGQLEDMISWIIVVLYYQCCIVY